MTQNKKRIEPGAGSAASRGSASKAEPPTSVNVSAPGRGATFEATLRHVIRLAEAVSVEPGNVPVEASAQGAAASGAGPKDASASSPARELLTHAVDALEPEAALKLRTLMVAGRDGRGVAAVHVDTKPQSADSPSPSADLNKNAPQLADYLRRGHAMACATGFDLEKSIATWPSSTPHTLDERAWLSFGVQLAKSQPDDWTCLGFVGSDAQQLIKLYLRLGEHAWWSFRSVLDRPSAAVVDKEKRALASRRSKGVATASLKTMADRSCGTEGRALRRAVRAIRARVGAVGEPA